MWYLLHMTFLGCACFKWEYELLIIGNLIPKGFLDVVTVSQTMLHIKTMSANDYY
mgnify:CR=1 FL=1